MSDVQDLLSQYNEVIEAQRMNQESMLRNQSSVDSAGKLTKRQKKAVHLMDKKVILRLSDYFHVWKAKYFMSKVQNGSMMSGVPPALD